MYRHRQGRCTKFVSFSGIDGAGKTTQIENFRAYMERAGIPCRIICFWDDVAAFTSLRETASYTLFHGDRGVGTPEAPISRRDKNVRSWFMSGVRLFLYCADAFSLRAQVCKALHTHAGVVVFDRYIYDELANLNLSNTFMRGYAWLMSILAPRPDISFLLDANPLDARRRKPEYPLEFLLANRKSYLTLSELIGGVTVVPSAAIPDVEREMIRHAEDILSFTPLESVPPPQCKQSVDLTAS